VVFPVEPEVEVPDPLDPADLVDVVDPVELPPPLLVPAPLLLDVVPDAIGVCEVACVTPEVEVR
jgi:hypothetical protein